MRQITAIRQEIRYYQTLIRDRRTPRMARWCLAAAVAYLLMPFDLIPDVIPVLGQLDDAVIVPLLVWLGLRLIPRQLKREIRARIAGAGS